MNLAPGDPTLSVIPFVTKSPQKDERISVLFHPKLTLWDNVRRCTLPLYYYYEKHIKELETKISDFETFSCQVWFDDDCNFTFTPDNISLQTFQQKVEEYILERIVMLEIDTDPLMMHITFYKQLLLKDKESKSATTTTTTTTTTVNDIDDVCLFTEQLLKRAPNVKVFQWASRYAKCMDDLEAMLKEANVIPDCRSWQTICDELYAIEKENTWVSVLKSLTK